MWMSEAAQLHEHVLIFNFVMLQQLLSASAAFSY